MLGHCQTITCSPVLKSIPCNRSSRPRLRPCSVPQIASAATSQSSTHRQHSGVFEARAAQLVSRQTPQLVHQEAPRGASANGAGRHSKRLKIAVDVDEVLGRFLHSLNEYCEEERGSHYDISDYDEYNFHKIWGCSRDEANEVVHEFFKSCHFAVGVLPMPGAYTSLLRLKQVSDLVIVTSRQFVIQKPTLKWLDLHYPGIFAEVHFGNHWALEGKSKPKSEICRELGVDVLIDDNPVYAVECAQAGINVLLYDWQMTYPWSKTADGPSHPLIKRVTDWNDVEAVLALAAQH